jgi:hypothetical protein
MIISVVFDDDIFAELTNEDDGMTPTDIVRVALALYGLDTAVIRVVDWTPPDFGSDSTITPVAPGDTL